MSVIFYITSKLFCLFQLIISFYYNLKLLFGYQNANQHLGKNCGGVQQNKWPKVTILLTVSKQVLVIQGDLTYL